MSLLLQWKRSCITQLWTKWKGVPTEKIGEKKGEVHTHGQIVHGIFGIAGHCVHSKDTCSAGRLHGMDDGFDGLEWPFSVSSLRVRELMSLSSGCRRLPGTVISWSVLFMLNISSSLSYDHHWGKVIYFIRPCRLTFLYILFRNDEETTWVCHCSDRNRGTPKFNIFWSWLHATHWIRIEKNTWPLVLYLKPLSVKRRKGCNRFWVWTMCRSLKRWKS